MSKRGGILYEMDNGKLGVGYHADQNVVKDGCRLLKEVDSDMNPVMSERTHRQAIHLKDVNQLKIRGFID